MKVEFREKVSELSEREREYWDNMGLTPPNKGFKWRRLWICVNDVFAVKEVNGKETIIEFYDGEMITVEGKYDDIQKLVSDNTEDDLEL